MSRARADRASTIFFASMFATLMVLPRLTTALFLLTAIFGIVGCLTGEGGPRAWPGRFFAQARRGWRSVAWFAWPTFAYLGLMLLQYGLGMAESSVVERSVLALMGVAWVLSGSPLRGPDVREVLLPAAALGAVGGMLLAAWQVFVEGTVRAYGALGIGPIGNGAIKFGDLGVVLGLLSLVLAFDARHRRDRMIGFVGVTASLAIVAMSGSRGALIGFMVGAAGLAWAVWLGQRRRAEASPEYRQRSSAPTAAARVIVLAVVLLLAGATVAMSPRFAEIGAQIERYERGDADTQAGQRLALWSAAARAVPHAPWLGVGVNRFDEEIARQRAIGQIPSTTTIHYRHVHNEYLCALATLGVGGFIALGGMFVLPILAALRRIRSGTHSPEVHAGLALSIAFAGFALTDCLFDRQITFVVFLMLTAWLMRVGDGPDAGQQGTAVRSPPGRSSTR